MVKIKGQPRWRAFYCLLAEDWLMGDPINPYSVDPDIDRADRLEREVGRRLDM